MDDRRFLLLVAVVWGSLAAWFALDGETFQSVVAGVAALVALSLLWWYSTHDSRPGG
jgi:hypothetical protein